MSIQSSEMIWRHPVERSDAGSNGGRMTATQIPTSVKNNIWPDVPQSERVAGSTKYRKVFIHVANDDDLSLVRPRIFVETFTPGDDSITIFKGTATDTQSALTGSEQQYGSGDLNVPATANDMTIQVMTEGVALNYFNDGDLIRISDKANVSSVGSEEYIVISGVPTYAGDVATITLATALVNSYAASGDTRVASVVEGADIVSGYSAFTLTGSGAYDDVVYPIITDSISTVEQDWTIFFDTATTYTLTSDTLGINLSGNISSDLTPNNPDYTKPYFTMDYRGFSGTFTTGNTITFTTAAAAVPIWYKRIIPAGANSLTGDKVIVAIDGESA